MRLTALLVAAAAVIALVLPARVAGWGDTGHTLTARIAMSLFEGNTAALMQQLAPEVAGNISDVTVASWPDTIRCATCPYPYTAPYHVVNLPYYQCYYNQDVDCGPTGCADSAIQNYTAQLADASSNKIPRNESLRYVVHYIGDIHQPLHAGNRLDGNGNALTALWFNGVMYPFDNATTNLHSIWDTGIVETRIRRDFGNDPTAYLQYLLRTLHTVYNHSINEWRQCGNSPQSQIDNYMACSWRWIQESSALACSAAYRHTNGALMDTTTFLNLSDAYYHANLPVVELRIMQAGVRMAHVLNGVANGWKGSGSVVETAVESGYSGMMVVILLLVIVVLAVALVAVLCLVKRRGMPLGSLFTKDEASASTSYGSSDTMRTSLL